SVRPLSITACAISSVTSRDQPSAIFKSHYSHRVGVLAAKDLADDGPLIRLCFIRFDKSTAKLITKIVEHDVDGDIIGKLARSKRRSTHDATLHVRIEERKIEPQLLPRRAATGTLLEGPINGSSCCGGFRIFDLNPAFRGT